jgi:hypothetical protein
MTIRKKIRASTSFNPDEVEALNILLTKLRRGARPEDLKTILAGAAMRNVMHKVQVMKERITALQQETPGAG